MTLLRSVLLAILTISLAPAEPLNVLLARLDKSAPSAVSFSATVRQVDYSAVVDHTAESQGAIRLKRTRGGVVGVVDYSAPSPNTVHFTGDNLEKYLPKANMLEIYAYGKYSKSVDQYLLLAFGVSGADLQKNYGIALGGEETIAGVKTTRVDLTPKDKEVLKLFTKIELWIPEGQTYAIQEKLYKAGGKDTLTWIYTDAKLNPALPDAAFDFKPPPGVSKRNMK